MVEQLPPERFSSVEAAIDAFRQGKIVIVVDAEDRENEGDFVCAASAADAETVNFMLRHGRGQVCMSILPDVAKRLDLPMMVETNSAPLGTAFTVPVDHRSARTGITAGERATAIAAILDSESTPADFVRPGHLFPLVAKEGGVLRRAGHTEATVDLARLAGLAPAGVRCEILDETGNRAGHADLGAIAEQHGLEMISIEELIRYRRAREKLVERVRDEKDRRVVWIRKTEDVAEIFAKVDLIAGEIYQRSIVGFTEEELNGIIQSLELLVTKIEEKEKAEEKR